MYRDSLLGQSDATADWMEEGDVYDTDSDEERDPKVDVGYSRLRLTKETKLRMRNRWKNALHGKVVGKSVSYPDLLRRLQVLWKNIEFDLMLIGSSWFVVNFRTRAARCKVLSEGPYFYHVHYIHLQRWSPYFDPVAATINTAMVRVRFPSIFLEFFDEFAILEAARLLADLLS